MTFAQTEPVYIDDPENMRSFPRVNVGLRAGVLLDGDTACFARTVNISEGGMLLEDYCGPPLARGRLIGVSVRGLISDENDGDVEKLLLRVVRHRGQRIALRFAEEY